MAMLLSFVPSTIPPNGPSGTSPPFDIELIFPLLALPLLALPALTLAVPVMLLFVYDKNNGVLEYLLSLGMSQADVFKAYLKASIFLASAMLLCETIVYSVIGVLVRFNVTILLLVMGLVFALSLSAVSFVTVVMMAFSSLQKQRVGANQPLGTGLGVMLVFPSIILPLVSPSNAIVAELGYSGIVIAVGLTALLVSGRVIRREKLLP
jgi:hypothetical protein